MQSSERGLAGNLIDEDTLERTLAGGLKGVPNLRPERAARALIEQLRGRNFMLCSIGGRSYAFVHRTFWNTSAPSRFVSASKRSNRSTSIK